MFTVEFKTDHAIADIAKQFPEIVLGVMAEAMIDWQRNVMPGHFRPGAESKYGYQPRTPKYLRHKKRRNANPGCPLTYTGRAKQQLTQPLRIAFRKGNIRGAFTTNKSVKYFWMHGEKNRGKQPHKPEELMTLTGSEANDIRIYIINEVCRRLTEQKKTVELYASYGIVA